MHVCIALYSRLWHVQTTILCANKGPAKGQLLWQLILGCRRQRTAVSVGRWPSDEISLLNILQQFCFYWLVCLSSDVTCAKQHRQPSTRIQITIWSWSALSPMERVALFGVAGERCWPWRNPGLWRLWVQVMLQLMLLTCSHNFSDGFGSWLMTTWCRLYVIVSLEIV